MDAAEAAPAHIDDRSTTSTTTSTGGLPDRPAQEPDGAERQGAGSATHALGQHGLKLVPAGQDDDVGSSAGHQPAAVLEPEIRRG